MTGKLYTVYWENKDRRDFSAPSALIAFIRALSYSFMTNKNSDISHIVDEAAGEIFYAWDWDVSYSVRDRTFEPGSIKRYSEDDVEALFLDYAKYSGTTEAFVQTWFERNRK